MGPSFSKSTSTPSMAAFLWTRISSSILVWNPTAHLLLTRFDIQAVTAHPIFGSEKAHLDYVSSLSYLEDTLNTSIFQYFFTAIASLWTLKWWPKSQISPPWPLFYAFRVTDCPSWKECNVSYLIYLKKKIVGLNSTKPVNDVLAFVNSFINSKFVSASFVKSSWQTLWYCRHT